MDIKEIVLAIKGNIDSCYQKKIAAYENTIAHTKGDKKYLAEKILGNYRISESFERKYKRKDLIETITRPFFREATNKLKNLILNRNTVKINAKEEVIGFFTEIAKRFEKIEQSKVNVVDFLDFLGKYYLDFYRDDANGFIVVRPINTNQPPNERVKLTIDLVYTSQVLSTKDGLLYAKNGFYYLVNSIEYKRYYKIEGKDEYILDNTYYYKHNLNIAPFTVNGGILISDIDNNVYYESFLADSLSHANLAIKYLYDKEMLRIMHARPITKMRGIPCTNKKCRNGKDIEVHTTCNTCNGTGTINNFNIGAVIGERANDGVENDTNTSPIIEFFSPPLESLEYHERLCKSTLLDLEKSLQINTIDESQSGVAKSIDEQLRQISVMQVAKDIYGNVQYILQVIADLLFINSKELITITYPNTFEFQSESQLLKNITDFKASGVSGTAILAAENEYTDFKFSTNPIEKKKCDISLWYDITASYTNEDIIALSPLNVFTKKDLAIRFKLPYYLNELVSEIGFLAMSKEQIKQKLDSYFAIYDNVEQILTPLTPQ